MEHKGSRTTNSDPESEHLRKLSFLESISIWGRDVRSLLSALGDYVRLVDNSGMKTIPQAWKEAKSSIGEVEQVVKTIETLTGQLPSLSAMFGIIDDIERAHSVLDGINRTARNPNVIADATATMSQSFAESLRLTLKKIAGMMSKLTDLGSHTIDSVLTTDRAKELIGVDPIDTVVEIYESQLHGGGATDLLTALLARAVKSGSVSHSRMAHIINSIKNASVSIEDDTKQDATLHPMQLMCIPFGVPRATAEEIPEHDVVDLTLPGATTTVVYDIDPLIDIVSATKFGSVATAQAGLSYKLAQRLRTIREIPVNREDRRQTTARYIPPYAPQCIVGPLFVTVDGGKTTRQVRCADPTGTGAIGSTTDAQMAPWAPLAGPHPFVWGYHSLCDEVIMKSMGTTKKLSIGEKLPASAPYADILEKYDKGHEDFEKALAVPMDVLLRELRLSFEKEFLLRFGDVSRTVDRKELQTMVVPVGSDIYRSYIMKAVIVASKDVLDRAVSRRVLAIQRPRVSYGTVREESGSTFLLQVSAAARSLQQRIRDAYSSDTDSDHVLDTVSHFQRVVAPAVTKSELQILKPTVKLLAISSPDA